MKEIIHADQPATLEALQAENSALQETIRSLREELRLKERMLSHAAEVGMELISRRQQDQEEIAHMSENLANAQLIFQAYRTHDRARMVKAMQDDKSPLLNEFGFGIKAKEIFNRLNVPRKRAGEEARKATMAFIDLNGFKQINDTFGHLPTNKILRLVGEFIQAHIREGDVACRPHGDEFIVLFQDADPEAIMAKFRNKETGNFDLEISTEMKDPATGEMTPVKVSMSWGLYPVAAGDSMETAMQRADEAMYKSKDHKKTNPGGFMTVWQNKEDATDEMGSVE